MSQNPIPIYMVERFQCPGCVCGSDAACGKFNWDPGWQRCTSHVLGTMIGLGNKVALGLPKGFNKPGFDISIAEPVAFSRMLIRLWNDGTIPHWDHLNVPVWAMESGDGYLFVRTFMPRVNMAYVDVIEGGTLAMVPNAIDVSKFESEIN